jgi:hypothetical protein
MVLYQYLKVQAHQWLRESIGVKIPLVTISNNIYASRCPKTGQNRRLNSWIDWVLAKFVYFQVDKTEALKFLPVVFTVILHDSEPAHMWATLHEQAPICVILRHKIWKSGWCAMRLYGCIRTGVSKMYSTSKFHAGLLMALKFRCEILPKLVCHPRKQSCKVAVLNSIAG